MNYYQLETSREIRLWLTQIIFPIALAFITIKNVPEAKELSDETIKKLKKTLKKIMDY